MRQWGIDKCKKCLQWTNEWTHIFLSIVIYPLHWYDYLKKILITINMATDKSNSQNKIWHWKNDDSGVAVQRWLWIPVELMAWSFSRLETLKGIQWLWVQIPLRPTSYSYFKGSFSCEYHMYQFILLHSYD